MGKELDEQNQHIGRIINKVSNVIISPLTYNCANVTCADRQGGRPDCPQQGEAQPDPANVIPVLVNVGFYSCLHFMRWS